MTALAATPASVSSAAGGEAVVQRELVGREEQLSGDGAREVAVGLLDELHVAEFALVAQVRELVLGAAGALDLAGEVSNMPRLAEQIQADVGERDVLLEHRSVADPLAEPLRERPGVVAEARAA